MTVACSGPVWETPLEGEKLLIGTLSDGIKYKNNNKAWKSGHSLKRRSRKINLQKLFLFVLKVTSQNL